MDSETRFLAYAQIVALVLLVVAPFTCFLIGGTRKNKLVGATAFTLGVFFGTLVIYQANLLHEATLEPINRTSSVGPVMKYTDDQRPRQIFDDVDNGKFTEQGRSDVAKALAASGPPSGLSVGRKLTYLLVLVDAQSKGFVPKAQILADIERTADASGDWLPSIFVIEYARVVLPAAGNDRTPRLNSAEDDLLKPPIEEQISLGKLDPKEIDFVEKGLASSHFGDRLWAVERMAEKTTLDRADRNWTLSQMNSLISGASPKEKAIWIFALKTIERLNP